MNALIAIGFGFIVFSLYWGWKNIPFKLDPSFKLPKQSDQGEKIIQLRSEYEKRNLAFSYRTMILLILFFVGKSMAMSFPPAIFLVVVSMPLLIILGIIHEHDFNKYLRDGGFTELARKRKYTSVSALLFGTGFFILCFVAGYYISKR